LAQDEARGLRHNYIGTEHILLGLLREEEGLAARVLESLNVTLQDARMEAARVVGQGDEVVTGQIPFTPRAKKVLELSLREALSLGHNYIGTEHILLGLVRENQGVAARILLDFNADAEKVRNEILRMLSGPRTQTVAEDVTQSETPIPPGFGEWVGGDGATYGAGSVMESRLSIVLGLVLATIAFPLGLLVGWLIWG
jgi:ATP-dependent Clp protease ATP-binding subunit ClpC